MTIEHQTILLADDSPTNLELVVKSLENDGCELVVATDGHEALERAERVRPDLILLDVMMPGLDGFEVCRQLKGNPNTADIPVIFMTSLSAQRDKLHGFAAGGVDYLTKPLQLEEVRARVKAHLQLRAMQDQLAAQNAELRANETRLRQSHDLLRALAARQDEQHEEERRVLAHKIHEDLAQNLSGLRLILRPLKEDVDGKGRAKALDLMQQMIDRSTYLVREMVMILRPTVLDTGIASTLRWLADDFHKGLGLEFELDINECLHVDDDITTFLFRAAQEILINVALHAAAHTVAISLVCDDACCRLSIRDDGVGFDPAAPREANSLGLARLTEQAERHGGELSIDTIPGHGTAVEISLPTPGYK